MQQNQLTLQPTNQREKTMKASFSNWRADLEQLDEGRILGGGR